MSPEGAVAVTGAGGYLGGVITEALADAGAAVRRFTGRPASPRDVPFSLDRAPSAADFAGIGALVHCAHDFSPRRPADLRRLNVDGSLRLLEAARGAGVRRVVFLSSLSAFEGCASLYGKGKLEVERKVLEWGGAVVRPGTVHGPRPGGVMGTIVRKAFGGGWTPVLAHPGPLYLAHEQDVAAAVLALLDGPAPGRPVFAAHPRRWSLEELIRAAARARRKTVRPVPVPWRAAWLALKTAEVLGVRPAFRSDSVLSLGVPLTDGETDKMAPSPVPFRDFDPSDLVV